MQISYLRYFVEIERTRSITQAAANLYLSQPNLSRVLRETEAQLGYALFERFGRGVRPTERGAAFLRHARRILAEMEAIEGLGGERRPPERFRVCMPRSAGILGMTVDYLNGLPPAEGLDAALRECHVRKALDDLAAGAADVAIIRYRSEYQDYFRDQAAERRLSFEPLNSYRYRVAMRRDHPLARRAAIGEADLAGLTEIVHGDTFKAQAAGEASARRRIYSVDRMAQLTLLERVPDAYMWSTALLPEELERWGLVQLDVADNQRTYRNALVAVDSELLSEIERGYMAFVRRRCFDAPGR